MIAFIDDHREAHGIQPMCKVLPITPSTYHTDAAKRANSAGPSAIVPTRVDPDGWTRVGH